jgi:hypothetical protein
VEETKQIEGEDQKVGICRVGDISYNKKILQGETEVHLQKAMKSLFFV